MMQIIAGELSGSRLKLGRGIRTATCYAGFVWLAIVFSLQELLVAGSAGEGNAQEQAIQTADRR